MGKSLFQKVWEKHTVRELPGGGVQLFIGAHLIHEVTSPQAFGMLRDLDLTVLRPDRTFATVDHIVPTTSHARPYEDPLAEGMMVALEKACSEFGIRFFGTDSGRQGIVHVIGPELGITQPGMTRTPPPTAPSARSRSASAPRRCATCSRRRRWRWRR
jgi:3-isopropylmalate/(R)-2-methylmalate dehydratase large subunit